MLVFIYNYLSVFFCEVIKVHMGVASYSAGYIMYILCYPFACNEKLHVAATKLLFFGGLHRWPTFSCRHMHMLILGHPLPIDFLMYCTLHNFSEPNSSIANAKIIGANISCLMHFQWQSLNCRLYVGVLSGNGLGFKS
jgi:hypothetical protein